VTDTATAPAPVWTAGQAHSTRAETIASAYEARAAGEDYEPPYLVRAELGLLTDGEMLLEQVPGGLWQ
jgi:hypothetical protein